MAGFVGRGRGVVVHVVLYDRHGRSAMGAVVADSLLDATSHGPWGCSHDEEPVWKKFFRLSGRGTIEHSAPDFFRPIFLVFSTTILSEQWLDFVDGYIIQPHVKSTIAAGPGLGIGLAPAGRAA